MTLGELHFDIQSLHEAYAAGTKPSEMITTVLRRITESNDPGIFIHLASEQELMTEAEALGAFDPVTKPLWGIPFAVKDNIDVAGMPTTAACPAFAYTPSQDATVVAHLKAAGAIAIGKTNLDQFATGLVGVRTPYPVPKNAINPSLVPGGSSAGSAVATARGIVSFALGTDTAGSGRIPAGLNNIVGLKPTLGALSTTGVVPACRTLDCVSIFALTVDDAYAVLKVAAVKDITDAYSKNVAVKPLSTRPPVLTVGVPAKADLKFFGDEAMQASFETTMTSLKAQGCKLVEIPFGDFYATANLLYEGAWVAERYAAIEKFFIARADALHPVTHKIIDAAQKLSAADAFKGLYTLQSLKAKLAPVIASVDLLCVPTAPKHFTVEAVLADPIATNSQLGTFTNFVNFLDLCGIAVPSGTRSDGLPMSITLLASAGRDHLVATLARDVHAQSNLPLGATGWQPPTAPPLSSDTTEGMIEIAVVGAHLSGMPLNPQLKDLGGQFLRTAKTIPAYNLYALAGQTIPKPGLLRSVGRAGYSIDVEVWGLSPAGFGTFVAAIPSPLGIGTLSLADGTNPKGFLVETAGLKDAADISHHGGWRNYVVGSKLT